MTKPNEKEVARQILVAVYDAWDKQQNCSLETILSESGYESENFHDIVTRLENQHGLIKAYGSSYTYDITPSGIVYVEENSLAPVEIIEKHQKARTHVLEYLCSLFEREGRGTHEHYSQICKDAEMDNYEMLIDLFFLTEIGSIKAMSPSTFCITDEGYQYWRGATQDDLI